MRLVPRRALQGGGLQWNLEATGIESMFEMVAIVEYWSNWDSDARGPSERITVPITKQTVRLLPSPPPQPQQKKNNTQTMCDQKWPCKEGNGAQAADGTSNGPVTSDGMIVITDV